MTRHQGVMLVLLVAILVVAGVVVAVASTAPQATGQINVTATLARANSREVGRPGRQSNASETSWRITDRNGTRVGVMLQQCRWITSRARLCQGELRMPLGKVTFLGSSRTPFEGEYAVTGGTGVYRSAGGVMLFTAIGLRKTVLLITIDG